MEVKKANICPRCGNKMHEKQEMNSLSRKDSKTYICSECGLKESLEDAFGDAIYSYTFKQALEDGIFAEIEMAKETGFNLPVYFTTNLLSRITPSKNSYEDIKGRTWDILNVLRWKISTLSKEEREDSFVQFEVIIRKKYQKLFAVIQAGVEGEPIITVMLPEDY